MEISPRAVPIGIWLWILGMAAMEVALVVAHVDFALGLPATIKSSIGWAKGWALMALFPLLGATLQIRARLVYRASCILALQTLLLIPLFVGASIVHLPSQLFVSPLQVIGGPGPEFFSIELYGIDGSTGDVRWRFFTPWAPAAAFVASIHFLFALRDRSLAWKSCGMLAAIAMCLMSKSRLGLIVMPAVSVSGIFLAGLTRPVVLGCGASGAVLAGLLGDRLLTAYDDFKARFTAARAASSRVRETLGNIAVYRWRSEAPIWGHGAVERGPHIVEYMPIGSHHSWYGLLFVKGIVGLLALAVPMIWSTLEMLFKAQTSRTARVGLGVMLVIWFYSFGENLEILAYLIWPGLLVVGIATGERLRSPLARQLGA